MLRNSSRRNKRYCGRLGGFLSAYVKHASLSRSKVPQSDPNNALNAVRLCRQMKTGSAWSQIFKRKKKTSSQTRFLKFYILLFNKEVFLHHLIFKHLLYVVKFRTQLSNRLCQSLFTLTNRHPDSLRLSWVSRKISNTRDADQKKSGNNSDFLVLLSKLKCNKKSQC